ncbi:MAG TPA: hypothetical protein PKL83_03575 [bacterium]|nr:hypothetical protein [bacterium]
MEALPQVETYLYQLVPEIHMQVRRVRREAQSLSDLMHGMCDFTTAIACDKLSGIGWSCLHFVGIQIPVREVKGRTTHASHTIGIVHKFARPHEKDTVVWFDYACAQYGIDKTVLVERVEKEDLYHRLREVYRGGIWEPGGSWLTQLDIEQFCQQIESDELKKIIAVAAD